MTARRAPVFLDKDGTLVQNVPYNVDPERIELAPSGWEALKLLGEAGHPVTVVSNQSGVARGLFAYEELERVEARLRGLVEAAGVAFEGMLCCPHHPEGVVSAYTRSCGCRKPEPGLVVEAARRAGAAPADCWMVGDILDDVEAGNRAGTRTVLICPGGETEWRRTPERAPGWVAGSLFEAARFIVACEGSLRPSPRGRTGIAR